MCVSLWKSPYENGLVLRRIPVNGGHTITHSSEAPIFKMGPHILLSVAAVLLLSNIGAGQDTDSIIGYKLQNDPTYMVIAPRRVYPNMVVQVQVSIFKLYYDHITIRASIRKDGEEHAAFLEKFDAPSTKVLQMKMLPNSQPGNYTLKVEGTLEGGISGNVFVNETDLVFDMKQISVFIQTNKPLYQQGQVVRFRIVPVHPNLLAAHSSMDIYTVDPTGTPVRRWLSQQTNAGILEMQLQLSEQPTYGTWQIRVKALGVFYNKTFIVEEFYEPRFFVNVSMPQYVMEDTFAVAGLITANHTSGRPVRGSGLIRVELRDPLNKIDPKRENKWPTIEQKITFFEGRTDFMYTMDELEELLGSKPRNKELHVNVTIMDWFLLQNQTGYSSCIIYGRHVTMSLLGDHSRTFKPGFPQTVYWALVEADGSPLHGVRRQVTINRVVKNRSGYTRSDPEKKLIVGDDGFVRYDFMTEDDAEMITVRASYDIFGETPKELVMYRVFSPTDNYIHIESSTQHPIVNEYMIFTVRTNSWVEKIYYMIVSKGNIVVGNMLEMHSMQKTFSVALSRDMVPSSRIIVYYVIQGEVVADGLNFFVNGTRLNPVDVRVNMGKDFSRDTVEITGITDPGSFISFSGNDYELWANGAENFITEEEVVKELETYDALANSSFKHTWYLGDNQYQDVYYPAPTYGVDANTTFAFAGLLVYTDANVTRLPHDCNITLGFLPCNDGSCYRYDQICDGSRNCPDGVDEMGCVEPEEHQFTPAFYRFKHITRHYKEDASWLWMGYFTKPDGRIDLRTKVPKEPMSWMVSAISMSREKGLGFVTNPARHQSTREFYIEVEMPTHSVRGEQLGVRIALFNYWLVDMECIVTLHDSPDYHFVLVEDGINGVVSSYAPKHKRGDFQTMVYVPLSRMATIYFPILPLRRGLINVTVSATSFMGRDLVTRNLTVVMDGVTNYNNTPYLIDLINQGSIIIPDFDIVIPEQFWIPEQRRHLYVPGSAKAKISIVGDVVGPGFFRPYLDAENLLRRPYGCAEQNAFNFAANLYYLKFLKITNQLEQHVLLDALDAMNLALQRQLSYMNKTDGSFSMFRDYRKPTPSTWLTAFVLKVLAYGDEADWRDILYIPAELVNRIAEWLVTQQDQETGAFNDQAPNYDSKMNESRVEEDGTVEYTKVSLTAHVLIALSEARGGFTGVASTLVDSARTRAIQYLERFVGDLEEPYQTALVTYALTVGNSNKRNEAFSKLANMKQQGEYTYWSQEVIPPNPSEIINTVPFQKPRVVYPHEASAVEATGYALLVYLQNNRLQESVSIMKWLQTMRNTIGGFGGTRDTIVALQALTAYGARDTNRALYNMEIKLEATAINYKKIVKLNKDNWAKLHEIDIPGEQIFGQVKAQAKGTGIALMQLHTEVNVEYADFIAPRPLGHFFNLTIDRLHFWGKNFSIMEMTACASWERPDLKQRTGMAVLEVGIPTGYIVMNDDLRLYVQSGEVPTLSRAEFYDKKTIFYLDYVEANRKTCVNLRADRWYPVANSTIQHMIRVYDYYEPGMHNTSLYTTYNLFNLHICQVCASFQCPYCPFYNAAPPSTVLSILTAFITALLVHLTTFYTTRT